mgnify:CR=1 FL=1
MGYILVIDDDYQFRNLMSAMLRREGYEVISVENGYDALALCMDQLPALVITDILMPDKEGLSTIVDLKREYPDLKIIAMSGGGYVSGPQDYLSKAEELGADFCIEKPVLRHEMLSVVGEFMAVAA